MHTTIYFIYGLTGIKTFIVTKSARMRVWDFLFPSTDVFHVICIREREKRHNMATVSCFLKAKFYLIYILYWTSKRNDPNIHTSAGVRDRLSYKNKLCRYQWNIPFSCPAHLKNSALLPNNANRNPSILWYMTWCHDLKTTIVNGV